MSELCKRHNYPAKLIDGWCVACTSRNEIRSSRYQHECYCPQCGRKEDHAWSGVSFLDTNKKPVQTMQILRKCKVCNYEWRQW